MKNFFYKFQNMKTEKMKRLIRISQFNLQTSDLKINYVI